MCFVWSALRPANAPGSLRGWRAGGRLPSGGGPVRCAWWWPRMCGKLGVRDDLNIVFLRAFGSKLSFIAQLPGASCTSAGQQKMGERGLKKLYMQCSTYCRANASR